MTQNHMDLYISLCHDYAIRTRDEHPYHHTTSPDGCPECDA